MKKAALILVGTLCGMGWAQAPAKPQLEVLRWNCDLPNSIGAAKTYGTVQNVGDKPLEFIKVTAEYFSDKEKKVLVGQNSSLLQADALAPGKQATFDVQTRIAKFAACWVVFENSSGKLETKYPDYTSNPPPRLP